MGLGDEIMALGRAEEIYERTGHQVSICTSHGHPRDHEAWHGNPAWSRFAGKKIIDGTGARPYMIGFANGVATWNMKHRARAGKVHLPEQIENSAYMPEAFAVVAPTIKPSASPNKDWGAERWAKTIKNLPIPAYQLCEHEHVRVIRGARRLVTPTFKHALAVIKQAAVVLCNEGGTHHMAASMRRPAVVIFGAFIPPQVTGYDFHVNLAIDTPQGYCGRWQRCEHCQKAMRQITPDMVKQKIIEILESGDEKKRVCRI